MVRWAEAQAEVAWDMGAMTAEAGPLEMRWEVAARPGQAAPWAAAGLVSAMVVVVVRELALWAETVRAMAELEVKMPSTWLECKNLHGHLVAQTWAN